MPPDESTATQVLLPAACWELLRTAAVGRLAVVGADGQPDIFPVNHVTDHGSVIFRTAAGSKLAASVGRAVAYEADGYDLADASAWSVVVKGVAREIWDVDETIRALALPLLPWVEGSKPRLVRIEPTSVSGRRFHVRADEQARPGLASSPAGNPAADRL